MLLIFKKNSYILTEHDSLTNNTEKTINQKNGTSRVHISTHFRLTEVMQPYITLMNVVPRFIV